jgi:iron(III) transport system permease protein
MFAVAFAALTGGWDVTGRLAETVLPRYAGTTAILVVIVGLGTTAIGTSTAWLVTATRFPGRRILEVALALPLAFPAYVLAYAYTDFLDHPGIVQSTLRDLTGWGPRDYWFPEIRSIGGAAAMLTFVLYPLRLPAGARGLLAAVGHRLYRRAYPRPGPMERVLPRLGARRATRHRGRRPARADGDARGLRHRRLFRRADLRHRHLCQLVRPLRPGGGGAIGALPPRRRPHLATLERRQRRFQRHHDAGRRFERMEPAELKGRAAWGAIALCSFPVFFGFALPTLILVNLAWDSGQILFTPRYLGFLQHSLTLASIAAVLTVAAAIALGFNLRLHPTPAANTAMRIAGIGYAVPGGVIAIGILFPFAAFDNALDAFMEANFGIDTGLLITGSIWLMIAAYMVRFMAVALNTYDAGLATVNTNIDAVARTLGQGPVPMLRRVHIPILRPSILTALLIVFVDVMKELPATLILRPFNYDTLAVQAHRLASDERLAEAAVPSLVIGAVGLLPVALLCWSLGRESRGDRTPAAVPTEV